MGEIISSIQQFFATTPPEVLGAYALIVFAPFPIIGVLIWGFLEVWLSNKQGEYFGSIKWVLLTINVPQDGVQSPKGMENFFNLLAGSKSAITVKEKWLYGKFQAFFSLEIVSDGGYISFYIRTPEKYRDLVEAAFYAQYPEAQIAEVEDYVQGFPTEYPDEEWDAWGSEMVLSKPSYLPIRTFEHFEAMIERDLRFKDPILSLLENMAKMRPGEKYMIQILIMQPDSQDWAKEGRAYIKKMYGMEEAPKKGALEGALGWFPQEFLRQTAGIEGGGEDGPKSDDFRMFKLTPEERDQLDAVKEKIAKLGWLTKIRFLYIAKKELFRKGTIASMTKGVFHQYAHQNWNKFGIYGPSTPKDDYPWQEWQMPKKQKNLVKNYQIRNIGAQANLYMLNSMELATIFHFPPAEARSPVLTAVGARRREAPLELGYAAEGAETLPNLERREEDVAGAAAAPPPPSGPLAVPHPQPPTREGKFTEPRPAPTPHAPEEPAGNEPRPQAGQPAPLPPGLDLSDQSIPSEEEPPSNLPIDNEG